MPTMVLVTMAALVAVVQTLLQTGRSLQGMLLAGTVLVAILFTHLRPVPPRPRALAAAAAASGLREPAGAALPAALQPWPRVTHQLPGGV